MEIDVLAAVVAAITIVLGASSLLGKHGQSDRLLLVGSVREREVDGCASDLDLRDVAVLVCDAERMGRRC